MASAVPRGGRPLVVLKLGGETLAEQHDTLTGVADVARTHDLVIVHGGGRRLTDWLAKLGVESRFEAGRRVTDEASLEVALAVLAGVVNTELVAALERLGIRAVGLTGIDAGLVVTERVAELGRVGRVVSAGPEIIRTLHASGFLPVVAPVALDERGEICNVNADEVAAGLAAALAARLVLLTDTPGVLDGDGRTIAALDEAAAEARIADGVIKDGMIPKVRGALAAIGAGVPEVVIADGRGRSALTDALAAHNGPITATRLAPPH
jgi:acetylglutamate kinase